MDSTPEISPEAEGTQTAFWLLIKLPLSSEMGSKEDLDDAFQLEEQIDALLSETEFAEVDGNEVGGGEYTIWILTLDPETAERMVRPVVESSRFGASAVYESSEAVLDEEAGEDYPMRLTLFIPLSDDEDGTDAERTRYAALAQRIDEALQQAELGEVDVVHFGEGEAIISAGIEAGEKDGLEAAELLQDLLVGETIPEDSRIELGMNSEEEDEADGN